MEHLHAPFTAVKANTDSLTNLMEAPILPGFRLTIVTLGSVPEHKGPTGSGLVSDGVRYLVLCVCGNKTKRYPEVITRLPFLDYNLKLVDSAICLPDRFAVQRLPALRIVLNPSVALCQLKTVSFASF